MSIQSVTIVTGGGRGIGRAIALRMASETAVLVVGKKEEHLKAVCAEIQSKGGKADYCVGDVSDAATAKSALAKVQSNGWSVRNLVLNAGISKAGATANFDEKAWRELFDVNVHGSFHFVKECLPAMLAQKAGAICFVTGTAGVKGYRSMAGYCASKHALVGFARSLALEVANKGVTVVPVCPGPVDTDMTAALVDGLVQKRGLTKEDARAKVAENNPQQRLLPPEEVAEAVALVLSGKVASLNGHPLVLSGGE
jgi:NAD(P)-dependent dehydrogenase (short-subunit alcohol dehydrogenase family)